MSGRELPTVGLVSASGTGSAAVFAIMYLYQDDTVEIRRAMLALAAPSSSCFLPNGGRQSCAPAEQRQAAAH